LTDAFAMPPIVSASFLIGPRDVCTETSLRDQTCSVGLAVFQPGESADAFIHRADEALYAAKDAGRARIACATA
jgi:PleD family two-component response regulator